MPTGFRIFSLRSACGKVRKAAPNLDFSYPQHPRGCLLLGVYCRTREKICTDLYLAGYEEFILYVTEHLQHPYHWGLNYIFDNLEMAQEAYEVLLTVCDKHGVDLRMVNAHKCEAHCRDILEADADTYVNGWFYCYSCKESDHHGVYSVDELDEWIRYYNENETDRQILIHEREEWCFPFKKKIRRSCRTWERELPEWAI